MNNLPNPVEDQFRMLQDNPTLVNQTGGVLAAVSHPVVNTDLLLSRGDGNHLGISVAPFAQQLGVHVANRVTIVHDPNGPFNMRIAGDIGPALEIGVGVGTQFVQ